MVNNLLGKRSAGKLHAAFDEAGAGNVNMGIFGLRPNMKIMDKLPSPKEARQFSTLLNIATNSIFIAADVPAVVTEIMSVGGIETGVVGEFAGPVGAAASVAVIIISQFVEAGLKVEKLGKLVDLTEQEKYESYWRFFLGIKVPDYIERNIEAKAIYEKYISKVINQFKDNYDTISISLPYILVKKVELATHNCPQRKKRDSIMDNDRKVDNAWLCFPPLSICHTKTGIEEKQFDFELSTNIIPSWHTNNTRYHSRIIPNVVENYSAICGPTRNANIEVQVVNTTILHELPDGALCSGTSSYNNMPLSETIERWFVERYLDSCKNGVVYKSSSSHGSRNSMYYIESQHSFIDNMFSSIYNNIDVVFHGRNISILYDRSESRSDNMENRYYFSGLLESCEVYKPGSNFFYITGNMFPCSLGGDSYEQQKNVVVIENMVAFKDSKNIHSIIGNNGTNYIEVSYAKYVDGKGGDDVITTKSFSTIKSYFGDFIIGNSLVLLPMNFSGIDKITSANNRTAIYNKEGRSINVDKQALVKTADGLFVTPTRVDNRTDIVVNLQVVKSVSGDTILDNELDTLRKINNPNFEITKQLFSKNYDITVGDTGHIIFYTDKENHNFYWEAPSDIGHLYLFDEIKANITIAKANGIMDFSQLNSTLDDIPFIENNQGEIKIDKNGLHITLLPDYKDVTVIFDKEEYYKLQSGELKRDYCSHNLKIDGRFNVNGTDLSNHHNCFTFNSDKVLFLKLNNDLLLLSDRGALLISGYYSSVNKSSGLSIGLEDRIIEPEEFEERADNPSSFRYYKQDVQGLQIYHNQPVNKNDVGLVDLKGKFILDFDMKVIDDNLFLSHKNNTLIKVENWNTYQPAREMMFAFSDGVVFNAKCIVSVCDSEDIVKEFNAKKKEILLGRELLTAAGNGNLSEVMVLVDQGADVNVQDEFGFTPLHLAVQKGELSILQFLLSRGAIVKITDNEGWTPLHWAAQLCSLNMSRLLVQKGARTDDLTADGRSPLKIVSECDKSDVSGFLELASIFEEEKGEKVSKKSVRHIRHEHHKQHHREHLQEGRRGGATSGASKPSSWMNVFANPIKGVYQFISSSLRAVLPERSVNSAVQANMSSTKSPALLTSGRQDNATVTDVPEINTTLVNNTIMLAILATSRYRQPIHENLLSPREQSMKLNSIDEDMVIRAIQQGKEKFGGPNTYMDEVEIRSNKTGIGKFSY